MAMEHYVYNISISAAYFVLFHIDTHIYICNYMCYFLECVYTIL